MQTPFIIWRGEGVDVNYNTALEWYEKGVQQGSANAMNNIGWLYANGKGVTANDSLAIEWYNKAINAGSANAKDNLAVLLEKNE